MTAVEWFDEQIQERIIAQDVVARKLIIEISMEDYMDIKKHANKMFEQQIIDAFYQCGRDNFEHIKVINRSATDYYKETYDKTNG